MRPSFLSCCAAVVCAGALLCIGSPAQAQVIAEAHLPEILILDPGDSEEGFNVVTAIAGMGREMKVVVFTTVNRIEHAVRALDAGASAYLTSASTSWGSAKRRSSTT